jgi:hypothetical protein
VTRDLANLLAAGALVIVLMTDHPFALGVAFTLIVGAVVAEVWR